jgi:hypothetical protein
MLTYDLPDYLYSLEHIGSKLNLPKSGISLVKRPIDGTNHFDGMGVWPYCTQPNPEVIQIFREEMISEGLISYFAILRPDYPASANAFKTNGFEIHKLKEHFVYDPSLPEPCYSSKTRFNINRGKKLWKLEPIALQCYANEIASFHERLASLKSFSRITHLKSSHFTKLAKLQGVHTVGAFDKMGLGAVLITVHDGNEIHFHTLTGAERAYKKNAFYALYNDALERWGRSSLIYLGGVPFSENAQGISRFKKRFSNRYASVEMVRIILNREISQELARNKNATANDWFPPYRTNPVKITNN